MTAHASEGIGPPYRHRQTSRVIPTLLVAGALLAAAGVWLRPEAPTPFRVVLSGVALILLVCLGLFASFTVEVDARRIWLGFGPGWVHRTIALSDIRDAHPVRNPWYYGWGIRLVPGGWMWNVSGLDAVELEFRDGRRFRIGTDEPEALARAIRRVLPHNL